MVDGMLICVHEQVAKRIANVCFTAGHRKQNRKHQEDQEMSDEFKEFDEAPTPVLTFGAPVTEEKEVPAEPEKPEEPQLDDSILTEEERKMVDDFSKQINLNDTNGILQYGVGTQKKMADFSETALKNVKTKDLGEVGTMISGLVTELKSFDVEEEEKGFLGFFKKSGNKLTTMRARYEKAEVNVEKICEVLEGHQVQLMKDVAVLDKMYGLNLSYFKELSMYILAGKKKLQEVRENDLKELMEKAERSGLPEDAQEAKDLDSFCNRFEKEHSWEFKRLTPQLMPWCMGMLGEWHGDYGSTPDGLDDEHAAIVRGFMRWRELGLEGGALFAEGKLVGFTVGEVTSSDTFDVHFEKAFASIPGAYPMVCREFARQIMADHPNIVYLNREDDMGHENLRSAKLEYYPEFLLAKYTAREAADV